MISRERIKEKYEGRCAYSGTILEDDWQVDHICPKIGGGEDTWENLVPVQGIINHYKRALTLEDFREWYMGGLHKRLAKLPKNPRTEKSKRRKEYMLKIASYFGITEDMPFTGKFYFETTEE